MKQVETTNSISILEYPKARNKVSIKTHGSKNCSLAIVMYTFLLGKNNCIRIKNVPEISDIAHTLEALEELGGKYLYNKKKRIGCV